MKPLLLAAIIGIAAGGALESKKVISYYDDIYPEDSVRREALHLCALEDPNFNRLEPAARNACYQHAFAAPTLVEEPVSTGIASNQVDLRQAATRGSAPRNDVRIVQQSDGSVR